MNTTKERTIKKFNEHQYNVELQELERKALKLIEQQRIILKEVGASSLAEFTAMLNMKTGWVNANLSAQSMGLETELKQLQEIESKLSKYNVSDEDVTAKGNFKTTFLNKQKELFTEYYTDTELEQRNKMQKAIDSYNDLSIESRQRLIIDRQYKMQFNPFIRH